MYKTLESNRTRKKSEIRKMQKHISDVIFFPRLLPWQRPSTRKLLSSPRIINISVRNLLEHLIHYTLLYYYTKMCFSTVYIDSWANIKTSATYVARCLVAVMRRTKAAVSVEVKQVIGALCRLLTTTGLKAVPPPETFRRAKFGGGPEVVRASHCFIF